MELELNKRLTFRSMNKSLEQFRLLQRFVLDRVPSTASLPTLPRCLVQEIAVMCIVWGKWKYIPRSNQGPPRPERGERAAPSARWRWAAGSASFSLPPAPSPTAQAPGLSVREHIDDTGPNKTNPTAQVPKTTKTLLPLWFVHSITQTSRNSWMWYRLCATCWGHFTSHSILFSFAIPGFPIPPIQDSSWNLNTVKD